MVSCHQIIISVSLVLILLTKEGTSQLSDKLNVQNSCVSKTTCRECIQTKNCAWCLQADFGDKPRCFQPSLTPFAGSCLEEYTWNPDNEQHMIWMRELTRAGSSSGSASAAGSYGESFSSSSGSSSSSSSSHSFGGSSSSGSGGAWGASGQEKIVQISPQRVGLKLRISKFHMLCRQTLMK